MGKPNPLTALEMHIYLEDSAREFLTAFEMHVWAPLCRKCEIGRRLSAHEIETLRLDLQEFPKSNFRWGLGPNAPWEIMFSEAGLSDKEKDNLFPIEAIPPFWLAAPDVFLSGESVESFCSWESAARELAVIAFEELIEEKNILTFALYGSRWAYIDTDYVTDIGNPSRCAAIFVPGLPEKITLPDVNLKRGGPLSLEDKGKERLLTECLAGWVRDGKARLRKSDLLDSSLSFGLSKDGVERVWNDSAPDTWKAQGRPTGDIAEIGKFIQHFNRLKETPPVF